MRGPTTALLVGLMLIAIAIGVVLSRAPLHVVGTNSTAPYGVEDIEGATGGCQPSGTLPRGTSAIHIALGANIGPRVAVDVYVGSRLLTRGERRAGWGVDTSVTVPVKALPETVREGEVCTTIGRSIGVLEIGGTYLSPSPGEEGIDGVQLHMEYLRPGRRSWLSLAPSIAHELGWGHVPGGPWVTFLLLGLMVVLILLATRLSFEELR